ncbi:MAG: hypothetical protein Q8O42_13265 [Acidobacteriota bacterium]|nr:hypothetical protein [Acidobacteriota bacterium]
MTKPSSIHHMLAILAGDSVSTSGDAGLAGLIAGLGFSGLTPDPLDDRRDRKPVPRFVRLTFPGIPPTDAFIVDVATAAGLRVESLPPAASPPIRHGPSGDRATRWLLIAPQPPVEISSAVAHLRAVHRIQAVPFRTAEE